MQGCKNACLLMLRVKTAVQQLHLDTLQQPSPPHELSILVQLHLDMQAAFNKLSPRQISPLPKEHLQLIKCFAALLSTTVAKLSELETLAADNSRCIDSSSIAYAFLCLWSLLPSSCTAFNSWPQPWPVKDVAEYASTRNALHSLMTLLIRTTRSSVSLWSHMARGMDPAFRLKEACTILSVPVAYATNISTLPSSNMMQEMSSLPADFFPLLCCLMLEQLNFLPPAATPVQSQSTLTVPAHPTPTVSTTLSKPMLELVIAFNQVMTRDGADPNTMCRRVYITPPVIQLCKRLLLTCCEQRRKEPGGFDVAVCCVVLTDLLANQRASTKCEYATLPSNLKSVVSPVSDVALLRQLFKWIPPQAIYVGLHFPLIRNIVHNLKEEDKSETPFCYPFQHEQLRGLYLALHHCCRISVALLRERKQKQQRQRQPLDVLAPCKDTEANLQLLVDVIYSNDSTWSRLSKMEALCEASEAESCTAQADPGDAVLLKLRHFHHLPGSVVMLEAVLRAAHHPTLAINVCTAILSISSSLLLRYRSGNPNTIPACISLAATLQKLMVILLQHPADTPQQSQILSVAETAAATAAATILQALQGELTKRLHSIIYHQQHLITRLEESKLLISARRFKAKHGTILVTDDPSVASVSSFRPHLIHQLQSVLLVSLVQMCRHRLYSKHVGGLPIQLPQPLWLKALLKSLGSLTDGLSDVVRALLPNATFSSYAPEPRSDSVWEEFTLNHFNKRLVPGCCYLGCTNLSGVSEAGLKTHLCSGCRRARYCSVECQKAAWLQGGHSTVCRS